MQHDFKCNCKCEALFYRIEPETEENEKIFWMFNIEKVIFVSELHSLIMYFKLLSDIQMRDVYISKWHEI